MVAKPSPSTLQQNKKATTTKLSSPFLLQQHQNRRQWQQCYCRLKRCNKKKIKNTTTTLLPSPSHYAAKLFKKGDDSNITFFVVAKRKNKEGLKEGVYLKLPLWVSRGSHFRHFRAPSSWAQFKCASSLPLQLQTRWLCSRSTPTLSTLVLFPLAFQQMALLLLPLQWLPNSGNGVSAKGGER